MIWDKTDFFREQIKADSNWPLPYDKWPEGETNCLAFGYGLTKSDKCYDNLVDNNPEIPAPPIKEVFKRLHDKLGLVWRELDNPEEAKAYEYVIQIYGWYKFKAYGILFHDFHVIRRELDGNWYHKPDFYLPPSRINWDEFKKEYPDSEISGIFAIRKP